MKLNDEVCAAPAPSTELRIFTIGVPTEDPVPETRRVSEVEQEVKPPSIPTEETMDCRKLARFAVPSALGLFLFLSPVYSGAGWTIPIAVIQASIQSFMGSSLLLCLVGLCVFTALASMAYSWFGFSWLPKSKLLIQIFKTTPFWTVLRILGAVFGVMFYMESGPALIIGPTTGVAAFVEIGQPMLTIFVISCVFLPLLTNYGAMEFIGTLVRPVFIRLFRLPGRAAIDAIASFVAAASVGILITIEQYRNGSYNAREAAAVATNFSVISVPFAVIIAGAANIGHVFFPWYISVAVACVIVATIAPRIPPLSRKPNTYFHEAQPAPEEDRPTGISLPRLALEKAVKKAERAPGFDGYVASALRSMAEAVFGVIGASMGMVVLVMIVGRHTPIFGWLTIPLVPLLEMMGMGGADVAAPGILVGFLDQFVPALIATDIDAELTRFVLAGLSVAQLIFMSEVGILLLRSILPLTFLDLLLIFLIRTAILVPVFVVAGNIVL